MSLKAENISFSYDKTRPDSKKTLSNINFEFEEGRFYSLLGPNGSGKTTFLDLLTGFLKPASGTIMCDGKDINSFPKKELAQKMALVSQDYYINFPYTVREVIAMGRHPYVGRFLAPEQEDLDIINKTAIITEITDLLKRKITCISGGERQRTVFTRALCQQTPFLLLDEAFSNMDINHSIKLLNFLKKQIQATKLSIISVFHDINFAAIWSDEMIFLKDGEIITSGSSETVLTSETIKKVYNIDSKIEYNELANSKQVYFCTN